MRDRIDQRAQQGSSMIVVSGDMVEGTITAKLLDRAAPGAMDERRQSGGGRLPDVPEFAAAVVEAADLVAPSGHTVFVGGADFTD